MSYIADYQALFFQKSETAENGTSAATNYWNKFRHIESWGSLVIGDVNGDLEVNLADVNDIMSGI